MILRGSRARVDSAPPYSMSRLVIREQALIQLQIARKLSPARAWLWPGPADSRESVVANCAMWQLILLACNAFKEGRPVRLAAGQHQRDNEGGGQSCETFAQHRENFRIACATAHAPPVNIQHRLSVLRAQSSEPRRCRCSLVHPCSPPKRRIDQDAAQGASGPPVPTPSGKHRPAEKGYHPRCPQTAMP